MRKLITFFGGFATGLIVGVLFTPARGRDTRGIVDHSVRKFTHEFKEKAEEQVMHLKSAKDRFVYSVKSMLKGQAEIEKMVDVHAWI